MKSPNDKTLISILGPTAVGKTQLSIRLAKALNTSILSADSRQFYEEMEIGTAKPSDLELASVPHFFINSLSVNQDFNVSDFEKEALKTIESILNEKDNVIMVGGSGLYHHAIWYGFDTNLPGSDANLRKELKLLFENKGIESLREKLREIDSNSLDVIDQNNAVRLMRAIEICTLSEKPLSEMQKKEVKTRPFNSVKIGLNKDRGELYEQINSRVDQMIQNGLIEEAEQLFEHKQKNALKTVGYQELFRYFEGEISREEAVEKIKVNSRRYAKRQLSWFKRYSDIEWFHPDQYDDIEKRIKEITSK